MTCTHTRFPSLQITLNAAKKRAATQSGEIALEQKKKQQEEEERKKREESKARLKALASKFEGGSS